MQADGTLEHVVDDTGVLEAMLQPINGEEPKEKDDLVSVLACARLAVRLAWNARQLQVYGKTLLNDRKSRSYFKLIAFELLWQRALTQTDPALSQLAHTYVCLQVRECMADSICVLASTELGLKKLKEIDAYSKVHKG